MQTPKLTSQSCIPHVWILKRLLHHRMACVSMNHGSHSFNGSQDVRIAFIAAGSAACHCLAGGVDGKLYTWGRNEVCPLLQQSVSNAALMHICDFLWWSLPAVARYMISDENLQVVYASYTVCTCRKGSLGTET